MSFKFSENTLIFWGIILLAALPRAIELLNGNYLFGFDQGLFYEAVKNIVVNHHATLIGAPVGGRGGFFQGPGWYYLLAIPFILARGDPYGGMILMFLLSIATVALAFFLGQKMFGKRVGIIFSLLIAFSPALISQARFIWPPFPVSLLTVVFLYFFFKLLQKRKNFLALAMGTVSLMFHFEAAIGMMLLLEIILFSPVLLFKKLLSWKSILLSAVAFLLLQLPLLLFDVRHHFLMTRGLLGSFSAPSGHHVTFLYFLAMVKNHLDVFEASFGSVMSVPFMNILLLFAIFTIAGVWYVSQEKDSAKKLFSLYLVLSPFLLFAVFLLYMWPMWEWWILELPVMYLLLASILIDFLLKKRMWKFVAIAALLLFGISYMQQTYAFYTKDLYDFGGTAKIKGKLQAIDYIYHDAQGKPFGEFAFTPPVYTYDTDYLFWWYGQRKYHYIPYQEKKGTVYLLIEKDPGKPWSYNGWLETVIKTGKVIKTVTLPSGYIVQKREF